MYQETEIVDLGVSEDVFQGTDDISIPDWPLFC